MMVFLDFLLTVVALAVAGAVSGARRWRLAAILFVLGFGVAVFNNFIEAVAFGVMPLGTALITGAAMAPAYALAAVAAMFASGGWSRPARQGMRPRLGAAPILGCILAYEILYFSAGMLVFPFVADFYAERTLPPLLLVAALQVPRALIFVAASWPWLASSPRHAPWALGIVYSFAGGIAPLLPENPYMPADIRLAHAVEVGVSNFLFGIIVGLLLVGRRSEKEPLRRAASAEAQ